jgi:REP element-mobilizing transposase RayT
MGLNDHRLEDPFFDEQGDTNITMRNLPHWSQDGKIYFVTWRLADSLPQELLAQLAVDRKAWVRLHGDKLLDALDLQLKQEWYRLFHHRVQEWLDAGHGSCVLRHSEVLRIMVDTLRHFDGQRYILGSFAIAGNHVHLLAEPLAGHGIPDILHSWKSYSANAINRALKSKGRLWMDEYFDRLIRDLNHLRRVEDYIAAHVHQGAHVQCHDLLGN